MRMMALPIKDGRINQAWLVFASVLASATAPCGTDEAKKRIFTDLTIVSSMSTAATRTKTLAPQRACVIRVVAYGASKNVCDPSALMSIAYTKMMAYVR